VDVKRTIQKQTIDCKGKNDTKTKKQVKEMIQKGTMKQRKWYKNNNKKIECKERNGTKIERKKRCSRESEK